MKGLRWVGSLLGLVAVLLSAGCGNDTELRWKEEVKLADGRIIVVTRRSEFKAPHEIGQPPGESHMWMEFEHPVTKEVVRYESKLSASSVEMANAGLKSVSDPSIASYPYALMLHGKMLYVVVWLNASIHSFYGCPDPPFLLYIWSQGGWERRPLEEIPQWKFVPNLTIDPGLMRQTIKASKYFLTAEQVVPEERGYGPLEFDFSGMTRQTFENPPNCATCTVTVSLGDRADSPKAGPFCTRAPRDWAARKHLTN